MVKRTFRGGVSQGGEERGWQEGCVPAGAPSNVCQTDAKCSLFGVFATDAPEYAGLVPGSVMSWRREGNGHWRVQREAVLYGLLFAVVFLRR